MRGNVIELGAGTFEMYNSAVSSNANIATYTVTDFGDMHVSFFESNMDGMLNVDACDTKLDNNVYDTHCSFEVMEHIKNLDDYMEEAYRILKDNGIIIFSIPMMYKIHGHDYHRITKAGIVKLLNKHGVSPKLILSNTGIGTTVAQLINHGMIDAIRHAWWTRPLVCVAPLVFFATQVTGYIIDLLPSNGSYATRYHVVGEKRE